MSRLRLLIVEDNPRDLETFRNSIKRYGREKNRDIETVECQDLDDALSKLDNSFDGAIIDLKLTQQGDEGNQVIEKIVESFLRIPVAIFTGNLGSLNENLNEKIMLIGIFAKGETGHDEILDKFWDIYNTGLTRIMGGRGEIEKRLNEVFLKNLLPQIKTWIDYGTKDPKRTEKALLRYTLNHLFQLLEEAEESCFPEEVYLHPPVSDRMTTGSIVKSENQRFVVLSPACDLVPRGKNGKFNTEYILLAEIENIDTVLQGNKNKGTIKELFTNRRTYCHWLPQTDFFEGGILNFRKLLTLNVDDFDEKFEEPAIQISPAFVKDIVSRFSSYYARQGQPDIDSADFVDRYTV